MAKGTVVWQFLSNFNVHMNNVEILIKCICESAFLTSSHDGDAAWSVDQSCTARCVQVDKKINN